MSRRPTALELALTKLAVERDAAEKANAENERRERIVVALERMVGGPLPKPATLGGGFEPQIPDFYAVATAVPPYRDLKKTIEKLKSLRDALANAQSAWKDSESLRTTLFVEGAKTFRVEIHDGLTLSNIMRISGIPGSAELANLHALYVTDVALAKHEEMMRVHFPRGKGRKANARAYGVAEALALYYLKVLRKKPGYGTTDGYASGPYMRTLEEIFEILGIRANTRGPAKAACDAITDDDVKRVAAPNSSLASLFLQ